MSTSAQLMVGDTVTVSEVYIPGHGHIKNAVAMAVAPCGSKHFWLVFADAKVFGGDRRACERDRCVLAD